MEIGADSQALDLDRLRVGQIFVSPTHAIDSGQIEASARQFEPQLFHLDAEVVKRTFFGGMATSSRRVAAVTMKLLVSGRAPIARGIVGAGAEISWPMPTRPEDVLQVTSAVVEITPSCSRPDRGTAVLKSEARNRKGEAAQVLTARLVVPRRTEGATRWRKRAP